MKKISKPRIWLVIGDKLGDNVQVDMVAAALDLPYTIKRVLPKDKYILGKPFFRPSLHHLDLQRSDKLTPPWPDLIITIGRRPAMAALAIQKQSLFHSKIVLLGRPKRFIKRFALIITPAQFQTPNNKQILPLTFPLIRINQSRIAQAGSKWKSLFNSLSRPITAVLVGGQTDPFRFDGQVADQLMCAAIKAAGNGCLYITTSRRTPQAVIDRIKQQLPENAKLFCWSADNQDNPYQALLALADRFIVTGDSISMMIEVAQLAKPLAIFELPYQNNIGAWFILTAQRKTRLSHLCKPFIRALQTIGLLGYTRDLTIIHQLLYQRGLATPLEEGFPTITDEQKIDFELDRVVTSIKQLFDDC